MSQRLTRKWEGEDADILRALFQPGMEVTPNTELLGRFGLKVIGRERLVNGYTIIIRHPRGALARLRTDGRFVIQEITFFEGDEAAALDKTLLYRMHPEDRAQIERVLEVGKSRWDVMVGLDQPNFKFSVLERRTLEDGKDRFVMQGKLFGILVILFTGKGSCESFEILENEDAMAERGAIAERMRASAH